MLAVYLFRATSGAHHQEGLVMTLTASSSSRAVTNSPVVVALDYHNRDDALSFVDNRVKDQPFLVGDICTIADIGCWGRMVFMAEGGFDIAQWPHLDAWAARLKAMPGFALPYDLIPSKDREFAER